MRLHVSLPLIAALTALAAPALATAPEPSGKFSRDPTGWTAFLGWTPADLGNMLGNDWQRIVDLHVTSTSPLLFTGATVTEGGSYGIGWWWWYDQTVSQLAGLSAGGTRRPTILKGYWNGSQTSYAVVMVDNTGSNYRRTWTFADISLASLQSFLAYNAARIIDMSTWLDVWNRHYAAIAIENAGSDDIALPSGYPQFLETSPTALRDFVNIAQANGVPARVIDLESEGTGQVLAVLAYDGALRNTLTNANAVAPDAWYYPALTAEVGALPEQSWSHVMLTTGARVVSVAPDVVGEQTDFDLALVQEQPLPPMSPLPSSSNDASNPFAYLDHRIQTFMRQYEVTGAAIAIARGPKLVYTRAYGYSDTELNEGTLASPNTLFRIGSISKTLATTAILQLIERGARTPLGHTLTLDTPVFREIIRPYLGLPLWAEGNAAYISASGPGGLENVTVRQVLSHSAGFEDSNCNLSCPGNPLTSTVCIANQENLSSTPTCAQILGDYMINKLLAYVPGSIGKYSNFGFCVAQTIVDALSPGSSYEDVVYDNILWPAHIWDAQLGNWLFYPGSDAYYGWAPEARDYAFPWTGYAPSALVPQGPQVDPPYGGVPLVNGLSAGGWKASATGLLKYAVSLNQSSGAGQLIGPGSFTAMFTRQANSYSVNGCGKAQTPTATNGYFGLTLEMQNGDNDAWKTGGIVGGGGIMVFSQLLTAYDTTTKSCANCITWTALVNTAGNGAPAGYDYDPPAGINLAMIDALAQSSIQSAIASATVDLFPTYVGP